VADNSTQGGTDTIRDKDRTGVKTQIFGLDLNIGGGTETLQTAAALADATANPTIPAWAAMGMVYNGTTWDRMRGDTTNGVDVDVTRLPALPAGTNNIGDVDVLTLPSIPAGNNNIGDVDVLTLPALPAGNNNIGDVDVVSVPTLTKGTQGSTGFSTQDLKDAGRVNIMWTVSAFVTTAVSEALLTVTESRDAATTTTFTSKTITSGKRLRITSVNAGFLGGGTTPVVSRAILRIRANTAGATTTASPLQAVLTGSSGLNAKTITPQTWTFPDGIEILGDGTKTIGVTFESPDWVTTTNIPILYLTIFAFEY